MKKFKSGDTVIVIYGKCKKQVGTIKSIINKGEYVIIEGLNIVKKNIKANPNKGIEGGIVEKENPIHISNISIFNTESNKLDRIKFIKNKDQVTRVFKSNNKNIGEIK